MNEEFIYWAHPTAAGIRVEEVSGGEGRSPKARLPMAKQIFSENGKGGIYREIIHTEEGRPLLDGSSQRISVSHAPGLLAVAMLPDTPEADLEQFSLRTCLGIDTERRNRYQVLRIRDRFLSSEESAMIPGDDVEANVLAWTIKEAVFKALLSEGIDFRKAIRIETMPELADFPLEKKRPGRVSAMRPATSSDKDRSEPEQKVELDLYSYRSDDYIVTIAYSPECAKFK